MWWSKAKSLQGVLYAMKNRCSTFWPCNTPFSLWSKGYPANSCLVVHWEELCTWPEKTSGTDCTYLQHMLQVQLKWGLGIFINLFFLFSFSSYFSPIWTCAIKEASFDPSFILIQYNLKLYLISNVKDNFVKPWNSICSALMQVGGRAKDKERDGERRGVVCVRIKGKRERWEE